MQQDVLYESNPQLNTNGSNMRVVFDGAATQIRTGDLILTKDALYLLSYSSISDSFDIITRILSTVNYLFSFSGTFFLRTVCRSHCVWYNLK